ncbi:hypothetical protein QOZ80_3BG0282490 [Eleusine coracana subsp. coracana]|nr:hypothetical protein QOZ80_3BG0282490 [Eleusine coracana subsp. coracana]
MGPPTSPPSPSWVILGSIPRVSADLPPDADLALALSEPPRVSLLTIPPRLFPDAVTPRNYPSVRAADPSGLLLLHANQGRAKGPTVIDRPGHYSFCWLEFVAGYFVLDTASASSLALPHPEYIMHPGHVGIIASPARDGAYMVAELQPIIGGVEASLLCFSDVGEWVTKSVRYPVPPRPSAANGVVSHNGRLWWVDLSWGLITCDPFADAPVLTFVPLPPGKALEYNEACGILDKYRAIRVSAGKLRFVDMYRNRDNRGALKVSVWTLADPDATEWTLEHEASFADIWDDPTYKAAGLPNKIPVLALIHPKEPDIVYFFLEEYLIGMDLRSHSIIGCEVYELVQPPRDLVATRFVHAWEPPHDLSSGFPQKDTTDNVSKGEESVTASMPI